MRCGQVGSHIPQESGLKSVSEVCTSKQAELLNAKHLSIEDSQHFYDGIALESSVLIWSPNFTDNRQQLTVDPNITI